MKGILW